MNNNENSRMELKSTTYEASITLRNGSKLIATIEKLYDGYAKMSLKDFRMKSDSSRIYLSHIADFIAVLATEHSNDFLGIHLVIDKTSSKYLASMEKLSKMSVSDIAYAIADYYPIQ